MSSNLENAYYKDFLVSHLKFRLKEKSKRSHESMEHACLSGGGGGEGGAVTEFVFQWKVTIGTRFPYESNGEGRLERFIFKRGAYMWVGARLSWGGPLGMDHRDGP